MILKACVINVCLCFFSYKVGKELINDNSKKNRLKIFGNSFFIGNDEEYIASALNMPIVVRMFTFLLI